MNGLEQLKKYTKIVADTGDIEAIRKSNPLDATTNPSLLLKSAQIPQYQYLLKDAFKYSQSKTSSNSLELCLDKLTVNFGLEILKFISGRVSTEIDPSLSFDTEKTINKARQIIKLYEEENINRKRILIKIASTWEGIQAAKELEKEGISCNLTLLFSFAQAIACAEAGVTLISPFVGRILDWYKEKTGKNFQGAEDPGVISVRKIYNYYKQHSYKTEVMGASFRNIGEIIELAGCDLLTISPQLLQELEEKENFSLERKLDPKNLTIQQEKMNLDEKTFRWQHNQNAMATEKLAEGIRNFNKDSLQLKDFLQKTFY